MIKGKRIYLSVCGFKALFILKEVDHHFPSYKFLEMINKDYSEFVSNPFERPDLTFIIDTKDATHLEIKKNKNNLDGYFFHMFSVNPKIRRIYLNNPVGPVEFEFMLGNMIIKYLLPYHKGFSIHGSAVVFNNKAYMFVGKSGAGKSTTVQMLKSSYNILSDSNIIISKQKNKFYAYETINHDKNWNFKRLNKGYLIDKVLFVKKSEKCSIEKITNKKKLLKKMTGQIGIYSHDTLNIQFPVIAEFIDKTDFYYAYIKKDEKIFKDFFKKEILKNEV
jgi:hypothetical protein